jgi:hypothetical protein
MTAKRAKELEREAKEKEFADGQHANMIDGVWHCSNCGCPEDIAVGEERVLLETNPSVALAVSMLLIITFG